MFVFGRGIDHGMSPLVGRRGIIVERAHLPLGHTLLWTIVVAFGPLWNFYATTLSAAAKVGVTGWVGYLYTIYDK